MKFHIVWKRPLLEMLVCNDKINNRDLVKATHRCLNRFLIAKVLEGCFNKEKFLVGAVLLRTLPNDPT